MSVANRPVLILGAGINGCAIARELACSRVPLCLVDRADIASGATAYSSRLIHGGLRYLEYGEFDLVRESLAERTRLLRLAGDFVRPLELAIPVARRWGGWLSAAGRFLRWPYWPSTSAPRRGRGLHLVRAGLRFYDVYARDPSLPRHRAERVTAATEPAVDSRAFRWLCSYCDGQIAYPERFTLALLRDAQQLARQSGAPLRVLTYHDTTLSGRRVTIRPLVPAPGEPVSFEPAAIINATGAWVDLTLRRLEISEPRRMGPTKGSHFFTRHAGLLAALGRRGVYAEAPDGRPVFILPLAGGALVGTTDEPFDAPPEEAVASRAEIDYLLAAVRRVFPQLDLAPQDIEFHYSGVRPLPFVPAGSTAGITRRHWLQPHPAAPLPLYSVIGGKLTTCRSLAEATAQTVLAALGLPVLGNSQDRPLPAAPWESAIGGPLTDDLLRQVIAEEWVTTLDDLVERRLMLLFQPLARATLLRLAKALRSSGRAVDPESAVSATLDRLSRHFGKRLA